MMRKSILFLVSLIFFSGLLYAQNKPTGNTLTGKVLDAETQEPLIGATLYMPDLKTGTTTDLNGAYTLTNLPNGEYTMEVKFVGYSTQIEKVNFSQTHTLDIQLKPSITELGTVIVTGVSKATEARKNPVPTEVMDKEDLERQASSNVIDAIASKPGVSQISTGPGISKPVIRGLGYNRVVTLNNGTRQEGQQWGDEHGIEIDQFSVDRVELIKGPGSIMYGSDAMAGVINFLPPKPVGNHQLLTQVLSNYQTNNNMIGNSITNAGNINGFNWRAQVSHKLSGNYQNPYDGKVLNSGFKELDFNGYVGLNKSWGYSHITFSRFHQKLGLVEGERDANGNFVKLVNENGTAVEKTATSSDLNGYDLQYPQQDVTHYKIGLDNSFLLKNSKLTAKLTYQENVRKEFGDPVNPTTPDLAFYLKTFNYDVKYILPNWGEWEPTIGISGMYQENRDKGSEYLIPEYNLFDMGSFFFISRDFEKLHLSGGVRYDYRNINSKALYLDNNEAPTTASNATETKFAPFNTNFNNVTGSIGGSYDLSENWLLKLNAARGFRAPNIAELASNGVHEGTFRYELGNNKLKAETSTQFDAGVDYNNPHVTLSVDAFLNNIDHFIYLQKLASTNGGDSIPNPNNPVPGFQYVQGKAQLKGGEVSVDLHPHPLDWLHFNNSFSYVLSERQNATDSTRFLPFTPAPQYKGELRANIKKMGGWLKNGYVKIGYHYAFAQDHIFSAYNTETASPAYGLMSLGLGGDVVNQHGNKLFSLFITADNVLDKAYQSHLSRLRYAPVNPATGRRGVYNMGRNISFKLIIPIEAHL